MAVAPNNKAILEVITNSALKDAKKTFDDWAKTYEEVCCTFQKNERGSLRGCMYVPSLNFKYGHFAF